MFCVVDALSEWHTQIISAASSWHSLNHAGRAGDPSDPVVVTPAMIKAASQENDPALEVRQFVIEIFVIKAYLVCARLILHQLFNCLRIKWR